MKKLLFANAIIEFIAGLVLLLRPEVFLSGDNVSVEALVVIKMYGIAAITLGILSYLISQNFEYNDLFKKLSLTFMAFHFMVGLHMFTAGKQGIIAHPEAGIFHLIFAIVFAIIYSREIKRYPKQNT